MYCKVDDKHIDIQNIGPPAINYGQSWRYEGVKKVSYEYNITLSDFIEKTSKWFEAYRTESIADSKIEPKGEYPLQDKYKENVFPTLKVMLESKKELLAEIIMFFDLEILNVFDSSSPKANRMDRYLINSLDWVKLKNEVSFGGIAYLNKRIN